MTNADKIRAMDLEDLATILTLNSYVPSPWCSQFDEPCRYITEDPVRCDLCALDWLKSPAGVEE